MKKAYIEDKVVEYIMNDLTDIYLYEGDNPILEICCRASEQKITCPINEPRGSFMGQLSIGYNNAKSKKSFIFKGLRA